jgi:hyperosmotically inducible protein
MEITMKTLNRNFLTLTLAGVLSAGIIGQAQAATASFKTYDSNGDGQVSLQEYEAQGGQAKAFKEGDANHDNFLGRDEFVKAGSNGDRITAGKYVDDAWITAKVKTLLLKDEGVKGLDVNVETHKGSVQLAGWVNNSMQVAQAEKIARSVEGVKAIQNDLKVKR